MNGSIYKVGGNAVTIYCGPSGCQFIKNDGTSTGVEPIGDAYDSLSVMTVFGDKIVFKGTDTVSHETFYVIMDMQGNMTKIQGVDGNYYDADLKVMRIAAADDELVVIAYNNADKTKLYVYTTDGTKDGTAAAGEIQLSADIDYNHPGNIVEYADGKLYSFLYMNNDSSTLWVSDLTAMTTVKVKDFSDKEYARGFFILKGYFYYSSKTEDLSYEYLWKTDGTEEGTVKVLEAAKPTGMPPIPLSLISPKLIIDDMFYINVYTDDGTDTYIIRSSQGTIKKIDMTKAGLANYEMSSFYDSSNYSLYRESGYALRWFSNSETGEKVLVRMLGSSLIKVLAGPTDTMSER